MEIEYGAEVVDRDGNLLGKVNYLVRNTWTGEISKFMVQREASGRPLFFSPQDVLQVTESRIVLNASSEELS